MTNDTEEKIQQEAVEEFKNFRAHLAGESPRGTVVAALDYLDELLEAILRTVLVDCESTKELLDKPLAPIGSFVARLHLARALGLLSDEVVFDLKTMAKIRNTFAHDYRANFCADSVVDRIKSLHFKKNSQEHQKKNPYERFEFSAIGYMGRLSKMRYRVKGRRLSKNSWRD